MKFLETLVSIVATNYQMDAANLEEFLGGMLFGLINKDDLPEIQKCLNNTTSLEAEFTIVISDLGKGDLQSIIKGIQELGQIMKELPNDLKDCKIIEDDVTKVLNWAKIFEHPAELLASLT